MSFEWTPKDLRTANLLDGREFDAKYNAYKGTINGGLDHMNLPSEVGAIQNSHLKTQTFLRYGVSSSLNGQPNKQIHLNESFAEQKTVSGLVYFGVTMDVYQGQWVDTDHFFAVNLQEGMLQLHFNCLYWMWQANAALDGKPWLQFRIQLNDNTVAYTGRYYRSKGNAHITVSIPVPQMEAATIAVGWRASGPKDAGDVDTPVYWFDGGTVFAINRYR